MRQLPLSTLFTFVVASRHLSFTKAAEELHLTQGAISQQIRQLESRLGFELFIRHHRRLELTQKGMRLAVNLNKNFNDIEVILSELQSEESDTILTLSVIPSLATKWLIPRLGRLQDAYPELQLRIQASDKDVDFRRDKIDVAILNSHLHNGKHFSTPLLVDKLFPVCSPAFAKEHNLYFPDQLGKVALLNDDSEWKFSTPYAEWEGWLDLAGVKGVNPARGVSFNRGDLAVQAAIASQGVALGRTPLVMDDLQEGRLVRPFNEELDMGNCYLFVCPEEYRLRPYIQKLLQWLQLECAENAPTPT
ncbi:LysR substrate-binding domain-containing protein [Marinomonas sp. 15G1-11]|uniref:LysR substrate-binding domain-containing protein n=1 Tax=Marinomonas phaeophyticola TaxID=3004091 RepID=A0ABT4JUT4_9GAMM|nr:LysR substrate-binding domain-containing protein [Marinomonas sp. 15G1-11]MCZ2722157.1 LysR substrate-binding domain-containing protein [Marinomonas sp. 15G1-11]